MEERRLDGDRVDPELGQDLGRGDRVGDIRLARGAALAGVGLDSQVERGVDGREVGRRVMLGDRRLERRAQCLDIELATGRSARQGLAASRPATGGRLGPRGLLDDRGRLGGRRLLDDSRLPDGLGAGRGGGHGPQG
jgi:hypothetical protein